MKYLSIVINQVKVVLETFYYLIISPNYLLSTLLSMLLPCGVAHTTQLHFVVLFLLLLGQNKHKPLFIHGSAGYGYQSVTVVS